MGKATDSGGLGVRIGADAEAKINVDLRSDRMPVEPAAWVELFLGNGAVFDEIEVGNGGCVDDSDKKTAGVDK